MTEDQLQRAVVKYLTLAKPKGRWSDAEVARLRDLYATDAHISEIRTTLGRSDSSIFQKAHVLGIRKSFRHIRPTAESIRRKAESQRRPLEVRFWRHVSPEPNSGCWLWTGAVYGNGYGQMREQRKAVHASHVALLLAGRPRPFGGAFALHSCDVPSCVNPDHLRWGTQKDNMQDAKSRGRLDLTGLELGRRPRAA